MDAAEHIVEILKAEGFLPADAEPAPQRLAGGVSSDVFRLETAHGPVCVKAALETLRVAADWRAPVERSHYEVAWLRTARAIVGEAVPEVLAEVAAANLFVMAFYDPARHSVWKQDLAAGAVDVAFAGQVGALLARIHAGTAGSEEVAARFPTDALFEALRLSPYLRSTAEAHPDLADRLVGLADRTAATRLALVHGDVSPKNILHGPAGPILLDAECAWYGDPAFDLAFCATHLLLKPVWKPAHAAAYRAALDALRRAYLAGVVWEPAAALDARAAALTGALILARIDGKSPVEYLTAESDRDFVRARARRLILAQPASLAELAADWNEGLDRR